MDNFLFCIFIFFVLATYFCYIVFDNDSVRNKRKFDERAMHIGYVCRVLGIKEINIEDSNYEFSVRVEDKNDYKSIGFGYSPYRTTDIYINDELVCKVHKLRNVFVIYRMIEYTKNRNVLEINEIISKAYKESKNRKKNYDKKVYEKYSNTFYK